MASRESEDDGVGSPPTVSLVDGSLLRSLDCDLLYALLLHLPLRNLAVLRSVSRQLRDDIGSHLRSLKIARGHATASSLHTCSRAEDAILHEDWRAGWESRWRLGPSRPPLHGSPAYAVLAVVCEHV